jgi:hypothetical protein
VPDELAPAGRAGQAIRAWNTFFFAPADPLPVGLIRVAVGLLLVWSHLVLGLELEEMVGSRAWADLETVRTLAGPGSWIWSFWFHVPDAWLWPIWGVALVVLVAYTLGLKSRLTAILAWGIVVSASRRSPVMLHGFDQVITLWAFYLALSGASGQACSLDRWLAKRAGRIPAASRPGETVTANLCLRMIQLHLCVIYATAGLAKLQGEAWWNGTAFGLLLGNSEFRPFDMTWLVLMPYFVNLATHITVAFELLYPVLIWTRWFRPFLLALAVLLHLGIAFVMGLTEFAFAMLIGNLAFVTGPEFRRAGARIRARLPGSRVQSLEAKRPTHGRTEPDRGWRVSS